MTTTITQVNSSTSAQLLAAADGSRTSLTIQNSDGNELFIGPDNTVSTTNYSYRRVFGTGYAFDGVDARQAWYGIWNADGAGYASITSITDPVSDSNGAAITTYAQLKTAVAAWLRPNSSLTADMTTNIPKYIGLAEVMIRRELHLRVLDQSDTSLDIVAGVAAVPEGYMATTSMTLASTPYVQITALPLDVLSGLDQSVTGDPTRYARSGSSFYFWPPTTSTAKLFFRRGVTPLTDDSDTNWILAAHPDVYLYGALLQADRRLIGPRLNEWKQGFAEALDSIKRLELYQHADMIRPMPSSSFVA